MFLFVLPGIILSGFMYPVDTMPEVFQKLTYLNPIRYFMEMVRGIFLKGQGVADLWSHYLILTAMALAAVWGASKRFRKSLE
jgi:ABC-2 type transport system permease protein